MDSDPIYVSFAKYLEKDYDFHGHIIRRAFGSMETVEIAQDRIIAGIKKMFSLAQLKELPEALFAKVLHSCDLDQNKHFQKKEALELIRKAINLSLISMRNSRMFETMLTKIFTDLDTNRNGVIELEEAEPYIQNYLLTVTGITPDKEIIRNIFMRLDKDKNKTLDRREVAYLVAKVVADKLEKMKGDFMKDYIKK